MSDKKSADAVVMPQCESEHVGDEGGSSAQASVEASTAGSQGAGADAARTPAPVVYRCLRCAGITALVVFILLIFALAAIPAVSEAVTVFSDEATFLGALLVAVGGLLQLVGGTTPDTRSWVNWRPRTLGVGALLVLLGGGLLALAALQAVDWKPSIWA